MLKTTRDKIIYAIAALIFTGIGALIGYLASVAQTTYVP